MSFTFNLAKFMFKFINPCSQSIVNFWDLHRVWFAKGSWIVKKTKMSHANWFSVWKIFSYSKKIKNDKNMSFKINFWLFSKVLSICLCPAFTKIIKRFCRTVTTSLTLLLQGGHATILPALFSVVYFSMEKWSWSF